jgi:hypothetical protein
MKLLMYSAYFSLGAYLAYIGHSCFTKEYWIIMAIIVTIQVSTHLEADS